jgi:hypothetical protein
MFLPFSRARRWALVRGTGAPRAVRALAACALVPALGLLPATGLACACGCGVFDVGTASMFAQHSGAMGYLEYDYMDQDRNWSGTLRAPGDANDDRRIRTRFMNAGLQYQFDRDWGVSFELPYWHRDFQTVDADTGDLVEFTHGAVGDIRIKGRYTGFSPDMSTGITLGVKLPNGETNYPGFDPDTSIGSGSTDLLLGAYHQGNIAANNQWRYFVQAQLQEVVLHKSNYRPGSEVVAAAGAYYEGWQLSSVAKIAPVLQFGATYRAHDGGPDGHPGDSGYTRLMVSPGVEVDVAGVSVFLDVGLPVHTNVSGNQLVASQFWRMNVSYQF